MKAGNEVKQRVKLRDWVRSSEQRHRYSLKWTIVSLWTNSLRSVVSQFTRVSVTWREWVEMKLSVKAAAHTVNMMSCTHQCLVETLLCCWQTPDGLTLTFCLVSAAAQSSSSHSLLSVLDADAQRSSGSSVSSFLLLPLQLDVSVLLLWNSKGRS